jgi:hypothetical protein
MSIPTAPSQITVGVAPNDSVFDLVDISAGKVTYRSPKIDGISIPLIKAQPVLTFTRREPNASQVTRRYETKVTIPVFDLLGTLLGSLITTKDNVIPMTAVPGTPGYSQLTEVDLPPILDEVMAAPEFQDAINSLTFLR